MFDALPVGRVRLADIDAPELGEPGDKEAKDALTAFTLRKKVYLDVDDLYVMDKYNRLIAVVYIRHNETHLMNINLALVIMGHAIIRIIQMNSTRISGLFICIIRLNWKSQSVKQNMIG